eukprot:scpid97304/ scgid26568/ 
MKLSRAMATRTYLVRILVAPSNTAIIGIQRESAPSTYRNLSNRPDCAEPVVSLLQPSSIVLPSVLFSLIGRRSRRTAPLLQLLLDCKETSSWNTEKAQRLYHRAMSITGVVGREHDYHAAVCECGSVCTLPYWSMESSIVSISKPSGRCSRRVYVCVLACFS